MPATVTNSSVPTVYNNKNRAKAGKAKLVLNDISKNAVTPIKTVEIDKEESTASLTPPTSCAVTPEAPASPTSARCAGGNAALVMSGSDGSSSMSSSSENTPSPAAKILLKQLEKLRSIQIVGAVIMPRNMKRMKKGRIPLSPAAKKNHQDFKTVDQEFHQILGEFEKQKRASRSTSSASSSKQATLPPLECAPVGDVDSSVDEEEMPDAPIFGFNSDNMEEDVEQLAVSPRSGLFETPNIGYVSDTSSVTVGGDSEPTLEVTDFLPVIEELIAGLPNTDDTTNNLDENNFIKGEELETSADGQDIITKDISDDAPTSDGSDENSEQSSQDDIVDDITPEKPVVEEPPLNFLSFPNKTAYLPVLSRDEVLALVAKHVAPLVLPAAPTKLSRAEKKVAQAQKINVASAAIPEEETESPASLGVGLVVEHDTAVVGEVVDTISEQVSGDTSTPPPELNSPDVEEEIESLPMDPVVDQDTPVLDEYVDTVPEQVFEDISADAPKVFSHEAAIPESATLEVTTNGHPLADDFSFATREVIAAPKVVKDAYVARLLALPNGLGQNANVRQQEIDLVALHVSPYVESQTQKQGKDSKKSMKEAETFTTPVLLKDSQAIFLEAPISKTPPEQPAVVEELPIVEKPTDDEEVTIVEEYMATEKLIIEQDTKSIDNHNISSSSDEAITSRSATKSRRRSHHDSSKSSSSTSSVAKDADRNMYIARHTFVGITSLEDFIVRLDFEQSDKTTTKQKVCDTFAAFAADECEALLGYRPDTVHIDVESASTLEQRRTMMGKTTLYGFLRAIAFDDDSVAHVSSVMRAFRKAAKVSDAPSPTLMMALLSESELESLW
jgi:hypothetical protein